jgi:hypothetical protein
MKGRSFCHLCFSGDSLSASLAHLASLATVCPFGPAVFLDCPVLLYWTQGFSHGHIPLPHFHGVKLKDNLSLCLVSQRQQEMAAPLRPI